ncbi:MAG: DUF4054 domain-containing protein [Paracoccus sp. (in: a-proteobacteria)]
MINESDFRQVFPVFADDAVYPTAQFNFWLNFSKKMLNECRWADLYDEGQMLFVAHHLVLYAREKESVDSGGSAGQVQGAVSSKSVDKVSVSFDVSSITLDNAGHWNLTTYGIRFYQLLLMVGMGGIQL